MEKHNVKGVTPIKAVNKTMSILECLSGERSLGITELTDRVSTHLNNISMDKSTMHRFLTSLIALGFVYQDPQTEKYGLTLKIFEIGMAVLERMELWREAETIVKEVARVTDETVHLAALDEGNLVYLQKIESMRALRVSMVSSVGRTAPTYCTGVGKVLLAHLPLEQLDRILRKEKLVQFTEKTIVTRDNLDREFLSIREKGYALDNEEHEIGVRCVAAPIRNNSSEVIGAVSISIPTVRLSNKKIPHYRDIILRAAEEISRKMGYHLELSSEDPFPKRRQIGHKKEEKPFTQIDSKNLVGI